MGASSPAAVRTEGLTKRFRTTTAVAGALNVVVVAWLSLGAAVLALGWAPRAVSLIGSLPAVGGFVV